MKQQKVFKLSAAEIVRLIAPMGGCIATGRITVDGEKVGYMHRSEPANDLESGWRFLAGDECQEYIDNTDNSSVYDVNTIANYDPEIIPFLQYPVGTEFERDVESGCFKQIQ